MPRARPRQNDCRGFDRIGEVKHGLSIAADIGPDRGIVDERIDPLGVEGSREIEAIKHSCDFTTHHGSTFAWHSTVLRRLTRCLSPGR
jgi:hypothetical protein